MDVSLASHVQYVPHVGCPHIEPVKREIKENVNPIGAILFAIIVNILVLNIKVIIPQILITAYTFNANHEAGT